MSVYNSCVDMATKHSLLIVTLCSCQHHSCICNKATSFSIKLDCILKGEGILNITTCLYRIIAPSLYPSPHTHTCTHTQIVISNKWGFTKWPKEQYQKLRQEGVLLPDGVTVQYYPDRGPLQHWKNRQE